MAELCYETINYSPFLQPQLADLPRQIRAAAAAGYRWIGLDIASLEQHRERGGKWEELARELRACGVGCFGLQHISIGADRAAVLRETQQLAAAADAFGPRWVQCGVTDPLDARVVEHFQLAALRLAELGAGLSIEFLPFLPACDIAGARELLRRAQAPNAALLIDSWHFFFGPDDWAALESVSPAELACVQFNDHAELALAPAALYEETAHRRVLPGQGRFELERFCRTLRARGFDGVVSVEVLSRSLRELAPEEFARETWRAAAGYWT